MNISKNKVTFITAALIITVCAFLAACTNCIGLYGSAGNAVSSADTSSHSDATVSGADSSCTAVSVSDAVLSEVTASTETSAATTTTASATSSTTTSVSKTTATTNTADTRNNAQYVVNPNYESKYYIVVFAGGSQSVAVYGKDDTGAYNVLKQCFTCSTGASSSPTRTGQYKIRAKYRWRWLVGNVYGQYSSSISSSYLFHSVPYLRQNPSTLDMAEYDKLGSPASHGCIRLCVRDAKWIYDNCPIGTQVNIVNASGPYGAGYPKRNTDSIYNGWDPSDPAPENPYINKPTTSTTTTTTTTTSTSTTDTTTGTSASTTESASTSSSSASSSTPAAMTTTSAPTNNTSTAAESTATSAAATTTASADN